MLWVKYDLNFQLITIFNFILKKFKAKFPAKQLWRVRIEAKSLRLKTHKKTNSIEISAAQGKLNVSKHI